MIQGENERIIGFDALRFFMVLLVIILHASMTFMEYVPQYWYVQNDQKSIFFTMLVLLLDCFPMTVLFFLAGYFSQPSFRKWGFCSFLLDKLKHIGLPWLLGVVFVAPFFSFSAYLAFNLEPIPILEFIPKFFLGAFYQQGHYWFLGLLFFMFLCYSIYARITEKKLKLSKLNKQKPILIFVITWIISIIAYYLSTLIKPEAEWINIGFFLYFQPARIIGYIAIFIVGIFGYKRGWFTKEGWSPNWIFWGIVALLFSLSFLVWNVIIRWTFDESVNLWTSAFWYNTIAIISTLFLTGLFFRFQKILGKWAFYFSPYSYGIYWLHMIILMPVLYILKPIDVHRIFKWSFSILFTLFTCRILSKYVLKRTKLF